MKFYMGLDVGGTSIKGVIINERGETVIEGDIPTVCGEGLAESIEVLADRLVLGANKVFSALSGVGVCCPGMIDARNGTIIFAGNLNLKNYPLGEILKEKFGVPVKVCNDANAAALGEAKFGAGREYSDSVLVTLGTGVGGGIVIGGRLFEGNKSAGAEIGHMVIERGGHKCTCGRRGCFEVYCSARALTEKTRHEMEEDTSSDMWKNYSYDTADARTAFEHMDTDRTAKKVVDWYIDRLACGLINLANVFRPQVIMLGGGVSAQGSRLTAPLQKILNKELFGGTSYAPVEVKCASLGNRAGALGAAALNM